MMRPHQPPGRAPESAAANPAVRIATNLVWVALAGLGVWLLRRDVSELNDIQIQSGQFVAGTAALMIIPTYLMSLGFEAIFGSVMGRLGLPNEITGAERAATLLDRVFDIVLIGLGIWTVALIAAIDLLPGIMALIALFAGVLLGGMGRLPFGRMMVGCGGLLAAVQILFIGWILLFVYTQTPEGGDLSVGVVLAMFAPGARLFFNSGFALYGMWRRFRHGLSMFDQE
jgi:hypothetical protein